MRKSLLLHTLTVFSLLVAGSHEGFGWVSHAWAGPVAEANSLPTSGDGLAFATKADGMVSTIEGFIEVEDFASAERAALELAQHKPDYPQGWMLLGYCQSRNARFTESNESYSRALSLGADSKSIRSRMAYNYIRLSEFDSARDCYFLILELDARDTEALQQLGYLEAKLGNYDKAAYYYRRVLENEPENTNVLRALARIEEKRGGNGLVKELLIRNLELDPDDTASLGRLGLIYIKEKNFKAAIESLERLVAREPDNIKAWRNLGVAHYQLGDKRKARDDFQRVQNLGGDMAGLYGPLAECHYESGARGDALQVIKEGIDNQSQEAWLYCMWGKILEDRHNYDGAIAKFSKAAHLQVEPWSTYARKEINRQTKLKKRAQMISSQQGM
ncbi:MAG: tetratricopeptide repeat protein [Candidatus Krumholzibacteria bacterium]|nr:tetratricopeptide repeat protein [Candidatus Krumholzibacteria bacterium]